MKKVMIALTALVFNMFLFSCNPESVVEEDMLYETQATEGDDEDVKEEREDE